MATEKFSIKEALAYGWDAFKNNVGFFIGLVIAMTALTIIPDLVADHLFVRGTGMSIIAKIIIRVVGLLLAMIATRISLDLYDTGHVDLSRLGELVPLLPRYIGGKIIYFVIVMVGLFLLIVPGLIWAYMFLYVGYLIVDRGLGPIEALQESRALTSGVKMDLFLFSLVVGLINLGGILCIFVGLLVTIPVSLMASAYVYRRLSPAVASVTSPIATPPSIV